MSGGVRTPRSRAGRERHRKGRLAPNPDAMDGPIWHTTRFRFRAASPAGRLRGPQAAAPSLPAAGRDHRGPGRDQLAPGTT